MEKAYEELAKAIIDQTKSIIGPVAVMQANTVKGLKASTTEARITGDPLKVISGLINAYKTIIGSVAVTLAKKGAKSIIENNPKLKIPDELK